MPEYPEPETLEQAKQVISDLRLSLEEVATEKQTVQEELDMVTKKRVLADEEVKIKNLVDDPATVYPWVFGETDDTV